jgi:hypothetical protein
MRQAILIEHAYFGVMPELKAAFSKTLETPERGLFGIQRQGRAKGVLESEARTLLPAEQARGVAFDEVRHLILWTAKVLEHLDGELVIMLTGPSRYAPASIRYAPASSRNSRRQSAYYRLVDAKRWHPSSLLFFS